MQPHDRNRRQPSGGGLNFPYGDCSNQRKARPLETRRTTARSDKSNSRNAW
jgi:hypothetical protein